MKTAAALKFKALSCTMLFLVFCAELNAQNQGSQEEYDISKPTNFYTFIDNNLEFTNTPNFNLVGYRANFTFSISEANLLLAELPLLYNTETEKTGIGDLRLRYFWLPYKNYENLFGAFGPSIDVFAPTGNRENGLGSDRWVIAPGFTAGIMLADWIQLFPVLSYQYLSETNFESLPPEERGEKHGASFQIITPVVFSERVFTQVTPIFAINDFQANDSFRYAQEILLSYGLKETLWLNVFYRGAFKDEVHTIRAGVTTYF